uniref:Uncharacterized protein n=1 Tax=Rhizophora mucronata TaxID=61149 RepID=A0A2P2MZC7_RHIMU
MRCTYTPVSFLILFVCINLINVEATSMVLPFSGVYFWHYFKL